MKRCYNCGHDEHDHTMEGCCHPYADQEQHCPCRQFYDALDTCNACRHNRFWHKDGACTSYIIDRDGDPRLLSLRTVYPVEGARIMPCKDCRHPNWVHSGFWFFLHKPTVLVLQMQELQGGKSARKKGGIRIMPKSKDDMVDILNEVIAAHTIAQNEMYAAQQKLLKLLKKMASDKYDIRMEASK